MCPSTPIAKRTRHKAMQQLETTNTLQQNKQILPYFGRITDTNTINKILESRKQLSTIEKQNHNLYMVYMHLKLLYFKLFH